MRLYYEDEGRAPRLRKRASRKALRSGRSSRSRVDVGVAGGSSSMAGSTRLATTLPPSSAPGSGFCRARKATSPTTKTTMLATASRAYAAMQGRDFVLPDDIKTIAVPALRHRIVLAPGAEIEGVTTETVIRQLVEQIPAPR